MRYSVRYGFGTNPEKLEKLFLSNKADHDDGETYIRTYVCFSSFLNRRLAFTDAKDSCVYYSLSANEVWLKKAIEWINSIKNSGILVTLEKIQEEGILVSVGYERASNSFGIKNNYINYDGRNNSTVLSKELAKENKLKGLPISRCALKIEISGYKDLRAKAILEYLVLVFLRLFDYREPYLGGVFSSKNKDSIVKKFIGSSNMSNDGHSLYNRWGGGDLLITEFRKVLDIKIYNNYVKENPQILYTNYAQTVFINMGLGKPFRKDVL